MILEMNPLLTLSLTDTDNDGGLLYQYENLLKTSNPYDVIESLINTFEIDAAEFET